MIEANLESVSQADKIASTANAEDDLSDNSVKKIEIKTKYRWSITYLRDQFPLCEKLFTRYIRRLQHGYFSLYLILQFLLSASYSLLIYFENDEKSWETISPDIYLYGITAVLPLPALFFLAEKKPNYECKCNPAGGPKEQRTAVPVIMCTCPRDIFSPALYGSIVAYVLIFAIDTGLPVYHYLQHDVSMRSPFTIHLIIASYIFFDFDSIYVAIGTGLLVTVTHLALCATITFRAFTHAALVRKLLIECTYFGCINGLGVYMRYMNEIMYRRSFLVKKDEIIENILCVDKQEQQRTLLEAIIPPQLAEDIMNNKEKLSYLLNRLDYVKNPHFFQKNLIMAHKNVTILYADIVNYTEMTTKIKPPSQLVQVLNDLFGSFDNDSEDLKVMRIKFLGDCYYCVSGLEPDRNPNHADSCIQLGLLMIQHIRRIATLYSVDLNMRIGVHTGDILSALIGRTKWQYEIWSKDVQLANTMESTGFPGKIHITAATMNELINLRQLTTLNSTYDTFRHNKGMYYVYKTNAVEENPKLAQMNAKMTYVVSPEEMPGVTVVDVVELEAQTRPKKSKDGTRGFIKRGSSELYSGQLNAGIQRLLSKAPKAGNKGSTRLSYKRSGSDTSLAYYHKYEQFTYARLQKSIEKMPLTKYEQWFHEKKINPFFLVFKDWTRELSYLLLEDRLYKYYISSVLVVLICFIIIRFVAIPIWDESTLLSLLTMLSLLPLAPMLLLAEREKPDKVDTSKMSLSDKLPHVIRETAHDIYHKFVKSFLLRTTMYVILCAIFTACFMIELTHCNYHDFKKYADLNITLVALEDNEKCLQPWNITETISLTLIMSFLFLKTHVWIKFLYTAAVTFTYSYWVWTHAYDYFDNEPSFRYLMRPPVAHIINIIYLTTTLHFIDRQADYLNRLDHKWNQKILKDKNKSEELQHGTLRLLENVMPYDVALKYLRRKDDKEAKKFYYEMYKSVAVMFATIVCVDGSDTDEDEDLLLMIMNEIISDFDILLMSPKYKGKVEKIKVANLKTYVACSGLQPGKKFVNEKGPLEDAEQGVRSRERMKDDDNLIDLLEFAADMMKILQLHNKSCNRDYQVRIGICDGKLTAGVVGTKKPHYDIWGDCVNLASRMDTAGEVGKIHIYESTQMVLRRNGIRCNYNKFQFIKGKSYLHTYYVELNEKGDLVRYDPAELFAEDDRSEEEETRRNTE